MDDFMPISKRNKCAVGDRVRMRADSRYVWTLSDMSCGYHLGRMVVLWDLVLEQPAHSAGERYQLPDGIVSEMESAPGPNHATAGGMVRLDVDPLTVDLEFATAADLGLVEPS